MHQNRIHLSQRVFHPWLAGHARCSHGVVCIFHQQTMFPNLTVFSSATNSLNHFYRFPSRNSLVAPRLEMFFSCWILAILKRQQFCPSFRDILSVCQEPWQLEDFDGSAPAMSVDKLTSICPQPEMVAVHSMGTRRFSWHSRVRRALGQERALCPSLVLHGLREMSFASQLAAIACISEFTLGFLHTVIGPGYARGLCETGNNLQPLSILWLPVPIQC